MDHLALPVIEFREFVVQALQRLIMDRSGLVLQRSNDRPDMQGLKPVFVFADLALDHRFDLLRFPTALLEVVLNDALQIIDIIEMHVGQLSNGGIQIAEARRYRS